MPGLMPNRSRRAHPPSRRSSSPAALDPQQLAQLVGQAVVALRRRPKVVEVVSWAAGNGDRSENGDYIYGKKRLREIDRRIRFLTKRLEIAEVVDPARQVRRDQVLFGVTYAREDGAENTITTVGADEADTEQGQVTWVSPIARALRLAREGDLVRLATPVGVEKIEVIESRYPDPA